MADAIGPGTEAPDHAAMAEDIEDLKAETAALRATVRELSSGTAAPEALVGAVSPPEQHPENKDRYPPFIFLLEGDALESELRLLAEWVEGVLVPGCLGEPSADARWCHLWTEHWDAVGALHALWLAWQELTDPTTCGYTGPSTWYRDHYRPCMADLRGPNGPFAGCTKSEHRIEHRLPGRVPSAWYRGEED